MTTTPTSGPHKRTKLNVRVTERGHTLITELAAAADIRPAHMTRRMLTYAAEHMPPGWVPDRTGRPGARLTHKLSVRITEREAGAIARRAARADVRPSHMTRRMLAFASARMPAGWVPGRHTRTEAAASTTTQTRRNP